MTLRDAINAIETNAQVVSTDLSATESFIEAIGEVFACTHADCYVDLAVIEVSNNAGYTVGHITFDATTDMYKFIPYDERKES